MRILKSLDWRYPQIGPFTGDGRYLVYSFPSEGDDAQHDIFMLAVDGSEQIPLIEHPADDVAVAWTPDGRDLLFFSNRTGRPGLWRQRITAGHPEGEPELLQQDIPEGRSLGVSSDGALYLGVRAGIRDTYLLPIDPEEGRPSGPRVSVGGRLIGVNEGAGWSVDGEQLAYVQLPQAGANDRFITIVIRTLATGEERDLHPRLVSRQYGGSAPRWSPDGRTLLVRATDALGRGGGSYAVDTGTGEATPLLMGPQRDPVWSPDGESVYFIRDEPIGTDLSLRRAALVRHNLETGVEDEPLGSLQSEYVDFQRFAISPDGNRVVFPAPYGKKILLFSLGGGDPRDLLEEHPFEPEVMVWWGRGLAWSADGRHVWFARGWGSGESRENEICRVAVDGDELRCFSVPKFNSRLRVRPDGRELAFIASEIREEVWVIENFLPAEETQRPGDRR